MPGGVCAIHGLHAGRACPACQASRRTSRSTARRPRSLADRIRSGARWKRTVARVLLRDGGQCTYGLYDEDDRRGLPGGACRARRGLDVHHRTPIEDGGDPYDDANLRTLCDRHHPIVERAYQLAKEDHDGEPVEF